MTDSVGKLNVPYSKDNNKARDEKLLQPYIHILQKPGTTVWSKLCKAFNVWLNIPQDKVDKIEDIIKITYNAGLVVDDIEDSSTHRNGFPVAHSVYGIPRTLNAAIYALFVAQERVLDLGHTDAVKIFTQQVLDLSRGQGIEIYWRENVICPTELQYKEMAIKKAGGLFTMTVRLMQLFSQDNRDYIKLTETIGLYFQFWNDYLNMCSEDYMSNKRSYCEDLSEGKFSFPIVHAIQNYPDDNQILNILRQRTRDQHIKKYCVSLLEKFGSFEYTKNVLAQLKEQIEEEVMKLGQNPLMDEVLTLTFDSVKV